MKLTEVEHVLRAAAEVTQEKEFVCIGSQALLGQFPDAPRELRVSMELDLYPKAHPEKSEMIDGALGELSPFHATYRYYAHGVGPTTAVAPVGWQDRLVKFVSPNTNGAVGWCLEVHDLAVSKLVAGRDKDKEFVSGLIRHSLASRTTLRQRIELIENPQIRMQVHASYLALVNRLSLAPEPRQGPRFRL
jgi:hypothetical protein